MNTHTHTRALLDPNFYFFLSVGLAGKADRQAGIKN